jgi:hypothetical protein
VSGIRGVDCVVVNPRWRQNCVRAVVTTETYP